MSKRNFMDKLLKRVTTAHVTNRDFVYQGDGVNLSFKLRVDIKDECIKFKDLLEKALADVDEEIRK